MDYWEVAVDSMTEIKLLAERLHNFYRDYDFYDYMDSAGCFGAQEEIIAEIATQLEKPTAVEGILNALFDIKANSELTAEENHELISLSRALNELLFYFKKDGVDSMDSKGIAVLVVRPGERPVLEVLDGSVDSMRKIVGGHLEHIMPFEDEVALVCNDEGKLDGLPWNRAICDESGAVLDVIAGPFFVCYAPAGSDALLSLPEALIHEYAALFEAPELFYKAGRYTHVVRDETPVNAYLGVRYQFHSHDDRVDIEFMDHNFETIDWHSVSKASNEYKQLDAVAKEWAGGLAIKRAKCLLPVLEGNRTVDERVDDAAERSGARLDEKIAIDILQLKHGDEMNLLRFTRLDWLDDGVNSVLCKNYDHVYRYTNEDPVDMDNEDAVMDLLENVYTRFNIRHPEDFRGHSLSTSDVVILSSGKNVKAFYCDWIGFRELPESFVKDFQNSMTKEPGREHLLG